MSGETEITITLFLADEDEARGLLRQLYGMLCPIEVDGMDDPWKGMDDD